MEFGVFLSPETAASTETLRLAELADRLGLELIGIQDHPYHPGFLDAWTLLAVIAARTSRIRVFPDVANLPLRPPAMLAKAAASLDVLSAGRVELGLGAGAVPAAAAAMGAPHRTPQRAVDALAEAITVIRLLWSERGTVSFTGEHYRLDDARPGPPPAHPVGIWVGAYGPRMLALTGQLADGWIPSSPYAAPDRLAEMNDRIDEAAQAAGRDPGAIRRLYNVQGTIRPGSANFPDAPAEVWAAHLTELALTHRIDGFVLAPSGDAEHQLRRFALDVAPAVRQAVEHERLARSTRA